MSENLIEMAKGLFSPQTESTIASTLNEPQSGISKALSAVIPAVFGGLIDKASSPAGAAELSGIATAQSETNFLDNIGGILGGNAPSGASGAGLVGSLFGNKSGGLVDAITNFSGLKSNSSNSLLSLVLPVIMGFLGKYIKSKQLDGAGLASLLQGQKQHVKDALPAGLSLGNFFAGSASEPVATATAAATHATSFREVAEDESSGGGLKWLLPVLLLALVAAASLYLYKGCNNSEVTPVHTDSTATTHSETTPVTAAPASLGTVDAAGNFVYDLGNTISLELPNGAGTLNVGENSTEAKLVRFLQSSEAVDTAKGNWFDFTNVRFNTGKATIADESLTQLKNMVSISKAFPNAQFKIGGYTDNTGNPAQNLTLSKERASAVMAKIKSLGADAASLTGSDGYGDAFPIGDNLTAEGRAQNRRVSVNVKAK